MVAELNDQLLDSWDIHNRMLFLLFDALAPEAFADKPVGMSGRSVGNIFAHVHNLRLEWIKVSALELLDGLIKIPTKTKAEREAIRKEQLRPALEKSAQAMRQVFAGGLDEGKLKNMKPHLVGSYSYFVAHEWYHIGEIGMTLTLAGHKLNDNIAYGVWSWGRSMPGGKSSNDQE